MNKTLKLLMKNHEIRSTGFGSFSKVNATLFLIYIFMVIVMDLVVVVVMLGIMIVGMVIKKISKRYFINKSGTIV